MITIKNYCLEPYTAGNNPAQHLNTDWLRKAINKLMLPKHEILELQGANTSLFFNHNPKTGKNRQGYPLVIYHYIDGLFYITGINEGAYALEKLSEKYNSPFSMGELLFREFRKEREEDKFDIGIIGQQRTYSLIEWRPIHHDNLKTFEQMELVSKANELNTRLEKQLTNELCRDLKVNFDGLKFTITDITRVYEPATFRDRPKYPAFDIQFKANIALPPMITLGNHQAWGYGRVKPL